jgi:hypothetical protein
MKIAHAVTIHHSENRPLSDKFITESLKSFHDHCTYDFKSFIIDNQSNPATTFSDLDFLHKDNYEYTYIEDQLKYGLTGAWNLSIKQAIAAGADIILLSGDDVIFNTTINRLIDYIANDPDKDVSIYGTMASNILHAYQCSDHPIDKIFRLRGVQWGEHLCAHLYAFTKEFYNTWSDENGDLFVVDNKYNGGDGKWGGQEGNVQYWAENGVYCTVVGPCWVEHKSVSQKTLEGSWRAARRADRERSINDNR